MTPVRDIDIQENSLRRRGDLLDILLIDRTTGENIIWATESYEAYGKDFFPKKQIKKELITGEHGELIQPRAAKPLATQRRRTKEKAEVFTPLKTVDQMNKLVDWSSDIKIATSENWQDYVSRAMLEISCGEAPFIVSRYNPTAHTGKLIKLSNRVGFLDRKLRVVSEFSNTPREWLKWAKEAYKASYGYEWQGDNLLIARENLLYSLIDHYEDKFHNKPSLKTLREFAEIISWNIFQMDGLKYVIPMSCKNRDFSMPVQSTFFGDDKILRGTVLECPGCATANINTHTGIYVNVMDWKKQNVILFTDISNEAQD